MTSVKKSRNHDPRALQVARFVRQRERPQLTILFGSRARGDHDDLESDIDVMLVRGRTARRGSPAVSVHDGPDNG